jgi:hypothetical protein
MEISHANVILVSRDHRDRDLVLGVCGDAFVNSAAQITVNLNKTAPASQPIAARSGAAAIIGESTLIQTFGCKSCGGRLHAIITSPTDRKPRSPRAARRTSRTHSGQQGLLSTQVAMELEPLHLRAFFPLWNFAFNPFVPFINDQDSLGRFLPRLLRLLRHSCLLVRILRRIVSEIKKPRVLARTAGLSAVAASTKFRTAYRRYDAAARPSVQIAEEKLG